MLKRLSTLLLATTLSAPAVAGDLIVMRHGHSQHNANHEYNSNPSHPDYKPSHLTPLGISQAMHTADLLLEEGYSDENIAAVFVSPLPRTQETAAILMEKGLFSSDKIKKEPRLIENQAGDREGQPTYLFTRDPWNFENAASYNGETHTQLRERIASLVEQTLHDFQDTHQNVLFITHGSPAYEVTAYLSKHPMRIETASALVLPLQPEKAKLAKARVLSSPT